MKANPSVNNVFFYDGLTGERGSPVNRPLTILPKTAVFSQSLVELPVNDFKAPVDAKTKKGSIPVKDTKSS